MTTVGDLCNAALHDSGIVGDGQTAGAEYSSTAFRILNWLLSQWNRKRWLVFQLIDVSVVSTGAESYSIGPGGDFNTPRPDRLEDGNFLRQLNTAPPNQVDYPLELIQAHEDYNRIRLKTMGTWPSAIFYDSGFPMGRIFPWPVPQASLYEIHVLLKNQLAQFTSLTQTIVLPPEYEAALSYNLQVRLRIAYRMQPDPMMIALAKDALNDIRGANVQIPRMKMPAAVIGFGSRYSVFSDSSN